MLEGRVVPVVSTWTGAMSGLWSVAGNWQGDVLPTNGSDLLFPAGASNLHNTDDLNALTSIGLLTIAASGYQLTGTTGLSVTGTVDSSQASGTSTLSVPIHFANAGVFTVDNAGATLDQGAVVGGTSGVTKSGAGTLILSVANTYSGATTVSAGTLQVDGSNTNSTVTVQSGATLSGTGTVGTVTSTSGTVSPGDSGPGILNVQGNLSLDSGSTLATAITGPTVGTQYSQLNVSGNVTLGNPTLNPEFSFTPTGNQEFILLKNNGGAPISGTFNNLAQGQEVTFAGQPYQFTYTGGTGQSAALIHLLPSTTTVKSSAATSVFGQNVTLTSTVTGSGATPTGTVIFKAGSTQVGAATLVGGTAIVHTAAIPVGTNSITAVYQGGSTYAMSTSSATTVTVAQAPTSTTLTAAPMTASQGSSVVLTALVAVTPPGSGTVSGTVNFFNGSTSLGTGTININNGKASLTTTTLPIGKLSLHAQYEGATNFAMSTSANITVTILAPSTTTLKTSQPTSTYGQPIIFTATVTGTGSTKPTGVVSFNNGTTSLGGATLVNGVATLTSGALEAGTDTVTATYSGDGTFSGSTSSSSKVTVGQASTTNTLTATPNPSSSNQSVTFAATITPIAPGAGTPTGTVNFLSNGSSLGPGTTLSNGVATFTTSSLPVGSATITAVYLGDANFLASTSTPVTQVVTAAGTTTTVTSSLTNPSAGQLVKITATVVADTGSATPAGTVVFFANGKPIGQGTLTNGVASFSTTTLPLGPVNLSAIYAGSSTASASQSALVAITVGTINEQFVNQIYLDVLGRPAEMAGLNYWVARLQLGATTTQIARGIVRSPDGMVTAVDATYRKVLSQKPTPINVISALTAPNASIVNLTAALLGSNQFYRKSGGTVPKFINAMSQIVLGTAPTAAQSAALTSQLASGESRSDVALGLLNSDQGKAHRVQTFYELYLRRPADSRGLRFYVNLLNQGFTDGQAQISILASNEFYFMFNIPGS
jgi:autotransporter-associated beta strand protein